MSTTPSIKVTLSHACGAVSAYKPGTNSNADTHGGLREAIVTCFSGHGDLRNRVELLRADIPGASWAAMDRAGAFPEMQARLERTALDLLDGHDPHVVVTLTAERGLGAARLVTNAEELAAELQDSSKRSLVVPRILPYQLGGSADGATAVIYSPAAGGGLKLHSMHPNTTEATMAEADLKSRGETKTGQLQVHTSVTSLLASVASETYQPALNDEPATAQRSSAGVTTQRSHPGLMPSPLAAPSPYKTA